MRGLLILAALAAAVPAYAEVTVVAARAIRARAVITPADLSTTPGPTPGALATVQDAVGMEARVAIYPGWPVRETDLAPPAVVERNQIVTMIFRRGGLEIATDGRSLGRAGVGERVRVMNLDSRVTVTASVVGPGVVEVR
jgi:flagella basal body P-ring formation protein FlgA